MSELVGLSDAERVFSDTTTTIDEDEKDCIVPAIGIQRDIETYMYAYRYASACIEQLEKERNDAVYKWLPRKAQNTML